MDVPSLQVKMVQPLLTVFVQFTEPEETKRGGAVTVRDGEVMRRGGAVTVRDGVTSAVPLGSSLVRSRVEDVVMARSVMVS